MKIAITFSDAFDHMYGEGKIMNETFILEVPDGTIHPKCLELMLRLEIPKQYVTASLSFLSSINSLRSTPETKP